MTLADSDVGGPWLFESLAQRRVHIKSCNLTSHKDILIILNPYFWVCFSLDGKLAMHQMQASRESAMHTCRISLIPIRQTPVDWYHTWGRIDILCKYHIYVYIFCHIIHIHIAFFLFPFERTLQFLITQLVGH